ncbi:porin [Amphritea sp. 1_MG-2023]|uniref:porin n=1 Tax=Amphritea sp. 1_MG-2023 TaxID=3062670 RepID=UPI0026E314CD|nr:porin [Amphritea sp. 1_MG-2023]MDO6565405.1 porin [Amphritea sp. 1_MG-2023]
MMKKLLLSSAVFSAMLTAPSVYAVDIAGTDVDVYGSLRVMLERGYDGDDTEFKDAASRVGIKASRDLGEGLTAFAKYEVALNLDSDADTVGDLRLGHLGLTDESLGTVALGKVDSAFYEAVGVTADYLWWNTAPVYYTLDGGLRVSESVYYASPDLNGFKFKALLQVDDSEPNNGDQVEYGVNYTIGNVTLGAAYTDTVDDTATGSVAENDISGVSAAYSGDGFYVNGAYINKENVGSGIDAILGIPSGKNLYTLGVSDFNGDKGTADFTALILAYQRSLHDSVLVWAELMAWDGTLYGTTDSNVLNLGMNFNF